MWNTNPELMKELYAAVSNDKESFAKILEELDTPIENLNIRHIISADRKLDEIKLKNIQSEPDRKLKETNLSQKTLIIRKALNKVLKVASQGVYSYTKSEIKTRRVIPTKEYLGSGLSGGKAYMARKKLKSSEGDDTDMAEALEEGCPNAETVVKKLNASRPFDVCREYRIGKRLCHENIVKTHVLIYKFDEMGLPLKAKIVMDKAEGDRISNCRLNKEQTISILKQMKSAALYLFENGVIWDDLNNENVFVDLKQYSGKAKLTFIDLDWREEKQTKYLASSIIRNSYGILGFLKESSPIDNCDEEIFPVYPYQRSLPEMQAKQIDEGNGRFAIESFFNEPYNKSTAMVSSLFLKESAPQSITVANRVVCK